MTDTLNQTQLSQIVSAVIQARQLQGAAPTSAAPKAKQPMDLVSKDRNLVAAFRRKGFTDVVLMDRNDKTKPFNVKPYGSVKRGFGWLAEGRIV